MPRVITAKLNVPCALAKLSAVMLHPRRRIIFVSLTSRMKDRGVGLLVRVARVPISGDAAGNSNHSPEYLRMRKRKSIVQGTRLREAEQEDVITICNLLLD